MYDNQEFLIWKKKNIRALSVKLPAKVSISSGDTTAMSVPWNAAHSLQSLLGELALTYILTFKMRQLGFWCFSLDTWYE